MKTTPTAHDALFKQFLTHPETARDFLEVHLPAALRQACDLNTLQLESGSFVEDDLRAYYSDVLYSLKAGQGDGYIYALIEHQSSPDKQMAFRLMRYAIAAMQRHLAAGNEQLPLVIPILFYHGQVTPYPYPMSWLQAFSAPELAGQLYSGEFPLVDVTVIPDDQIMQHRRVAILELLQKNYMLQVGETRNPGELLSTLASRVPEHEDTLMTIAEKLRLEGEQRGLQKGMLLGEEKGRQEGMLEGKLEVARTMLANGLDRDSVMKMTGLTADDLAQIRH